MENLKKYATERQREYINAVQKYGTQAKAAQALNVNKRTLERSLSSLRKRAALNSPQEHNYGKSDVPEGFSLRGVSTLVDKDGNKVMEWIKSHKDLDITREVIQEFISDLVNDAKGLSPNIKPPKNSNKDLLCVYPMGDPHFGMHAWADEAGEDFDLKEAENITKEAIDRLIASAPNAETGLILELGDFFHADNKLSRTERSGNILDVDTRWQKVMQVGLRSMVYCISSALGKHKNVIVRIVEGNHDSHSSFALALALDSYFHNNKRVTVELSPKNFWFYKFGNVLIGATHGHTCKMDMLPAIMATDTPKYWGDTEHRYWYLGHVHHQNVKEYPGVVCETFRTLAASDAWHAASGYRSGRDMCCIVHHKDYGEIERHRCNIAMIRK